MVIHERMKNRLMQTLNGDFARDAFLINAIEVLFGESPQEEQKNFYSSLIFLLTHLEFSEEEARQHWKNIVKRHDELSETLSRDINLRMAIIDHFTAAHDYLKNPMVIELKLYEVTRRQAMIDELTGIYNYRYFQECLESEMKRSQRYSLSFSVVFMDMDNLKTINDQYGHLKGDEVLKEVAMAMYEQKRAEDVICRYGGDEFIFLLPQTGPNGPISFVDRLCSDIADRPILKEMGVTMSAGIATYPSDADNLTELLKLADGALYEAKRQGKACTRFASELRPEDS